MLAGVILLLQTAWRQARPFCLKAVFLAASALVPVAISLTAIFNLLPPNALNPTIPGFGLAALLAAAAIFRFDFLKSAPAAHEEETPPADAQDKRLRALFLLIFALTVAGIAAIGSLSYQNYATQFRAQVEAQLSVIAALKIDELEDWHTERLGDAEVLHQNLAFSDLVQRVLDNDGNATAQEELQTWLDNLLAAYHYERIYLLDTAGEVRISSPPESGMVSAHTLDEVTATLEGGQVVFLDFHIHEEDQTIHLCLLVPVYAGQDPDQPLGVLVMEIAPATYLYPYLAKWPVPSETAETLLVRRDGEDILFLNPLRFEPDAALNLRVPLANTDILAVKAVLGETGVVEGLDYRGKAVIGYVGPVPGSPWFLVARMDTAEVYSLLRQRQWQTLIFFGALIAVSGAGLILFWRQQRVRHYQMQAKAADALRASEERFRTLYENSTVGIYRTTPDGRILLANPTLVEMLGYSSFEELAARNLEREGFGPSHSRARFLEAIEKSGEVRGLEASWVRKDRTMIFVRESARAIRDAQGKTLYYDGIVEDITERKRAEEERALLFNTLTASLNEIYIFDSETLKFQFVNSGALQNLQISLEQAQQMTPLDIKPKLSEADFQKLIAPLRTGEKRVQVFETVHRRADGTLYPVEVHLQLFENEKIFLAVIQDITERKQAEDALRASEKLWFIGNRRD